MKVGLVGYEKKSISSTTSIAAVMKCLIFYCVERKEEACSKTKNGFDKKSVESVLRRLHCLANLM